VDRRRILVSCAKGVAPLLARELDALGFGDRVERPAGVETSGAFEDTLRLNLHLRTAQRVLYTVAEFGARTADDLYRALVRVPWEEYVPADGYVRVASSVRTPEIRDPRFANLRAKDALVDRIRSRCGRRPESGPESDRTVVFLYWEGDRVRVYLDTSGESLARRNYRKAGAKAPMQESLAAAVIMATGWDGTSHFVNPMCGSGTLAIEAALLALRRPPGLLRDNFGFMHIRGFDAGVWRQVREAALRGAHGDCCAKIIASDIDPGAVDAARRNARTAEVDRVIEFRTCDFAQTPVPPGGGVVVLNPAYGQRMGKDEDLSALYRRIGDFFKQRCQGYTGHVFTGNSGLAKVIGLRSARRIPFYNGEMECRLIAFRIYEGSVRQKYRLPAV
jgi:putative N6-adenine-specific DNA methylase